MKQILEMFAGYNKWANRPLYAVAAELPDADYRADHGAFFGSVHGTLHHLLAGDSIWMRRLTGEGEAPASLDAIIHDDFADLRERRTKRRTSGSSPMRQHCRMAILPAPCAIAPSAARRTSSRSSCGS